MRSKALRQIADAIRFLEWLEKLPPEDFLRGERCLIGVLLSLRSVEILQPQHVAAAFHGPVPGLGEERFGSLGEGTEQRASRVLLHWR